METVTLDRPAIVATLTAQGVRPDIAALYADAFLEYRDASANIREHGAIVSHPRTGNPIENPFLAVRDRARAALQKMRLSIAQAAELWKDGGA